MKRASAEKKRYEALRRRRSHNPPKTHTKHDGRRLVRVYVEGYEDVAFWRGIFDHFHNRYVRFEISVPNREDLPKGKKVLMSMIPSSSEELLLCVDSDFDYLFGDTTPQSAEIHAAQYMFHTYTYATENYLCYAPSLHNVCVKATKNDCHIFDFVRFMADKDVPYESKTRLALDLLKRTAKEERYDADFAEDLKQIEAKLKDQKADNLRTYRAEITDLLNSDIVLRHNYYEGVVEYNLAADSTVMRAVELLNDGDRYTEILSEQDSERN